MLKEFLQNPSKEGGHRAVGSQPDQRQMLWQVRACTRTPLNDSTLRRSGICHV